MAFSVDPRVAPYYDVTFILCGCVACRNCGCEPMYASRHKPYTDENYYDQAAAMADQGSAVHRENLDAFCPACAEREIGRHRIAHSMMTPEQRRDAFHDLAARLDAIHNELSQLQAQLQFEVDRTAVQAILTDLVWAAENCTVVGLHHVGQAMDDAMGIGNGRVA